MDWDDLRHVLALARTRSVRAAGAALGVSHSTIGRRLASLEARLGVKLFDRHRDGFLITPAGAELVERASRIEEEFSEIERSLEGRDRKLEGSVRVTCSDVYVARILFDALAPLALAHAGIDLRVGAESRSLDLSKREADVAIRALRVGDRPPSHLVGRLLAPIVVASYVGTAHRERLDPDRGGGPTRFLGSDPPNAIAELVATSSHPGLSVWGRFGSLELLVEATRRGLGLAMLPTYAGDVSPGLERLVRPDTRHVGDLWLLTHPGLRDNARLRAARTAIAGAMRSQAPLFRGAWTESAPPRPVHGPSASRRRR